MKKYLMLLSCAGVLTMASCSQDKPADTAATDTTATSTSTDASGTGTAAMGGYSDADYNTRADRISSDLATKMKLDEATKTKVRTVYYNRSKRLGELHDKYASDTTGMAADMRSVYSDADTELKTVFTDPAQYSTYESSRDEYLEDRYMTTPSSMSDGSSMSSDGSTSSDMGSTSTTTTTMTEESSTSDMGSAAGSGMAVSKLKAKDADGAKLKVKDNGKVKVKTPEGEKSKM